MTRGELRTVETARVRLDGGTQVRVDLYVDDVVQSYADAIEAGEDLPPIDVVEDGDHLWLVDGYHRHAAHLRLRRAVISARVTRGTREDAQWLAAAANADHGLRRTNADKRAAVRLALAHPRAAQTSIAQIAKHCRVSRTLADEVAREVARERDEREPDRRLGADGKWRKARADQPAKKQVEHLTPRNHTTEDLEMPPPPHTPPPPRTRPRASLDTSTADDVPPDDEWIPDDERAADEEAPVARSSASSGRSRGEIAIAILGARVADLRAWLGALARDAAALRGAITRAEAVAPETVVPAQLATRWPLGDALRGVSLALDELEPSGLCDACGGEGCARCGGVGWTSVAAARAAERRDEAVSQARARRRR